MILLSTVSKMFLPRLHTVTRVRIVISNYHYIMRLLVDTIMIV